MILYLDASALVKRYVREARTEDVIGWIDAAEMVVTGLITRVEVAAAIARAGRVGVVPEVQVLPALQQLRSDWGKIQRLPMTEDTVIRGDSLAVDLALRGIVAIHLACALIWQETYGEPVTMVSFDRKLVDAARAMQMDCLPS